MGVTQTRYTSEESTIPRPGTWIFKWPLHLGARPALYSPPLPAVLPLTLALSASNLPISLRCSFQITDNQHTLHSQQPHLRLQLRAHSVTLYLQLYTTFQLQSFTEQTSLCQLSKTSKPLVSPTPLSARPSSLLPTSTTTFSPILCVHDLG